MKRFLKSAGFKVLVAVAVFLLSIIIYSAVSRGTATVPEQVAGGILSPLQSLFSNAVDAVGDFFSGLGDDTALREENEQLKQELGDLRDQMIDYDDMKRKYDQLVAFLELKEQHPDYQFADASVIAKDPTDIYGNFTIDAGSLQDVSVGDPVIQADGLVGVVSEVGLNWARVSTILDVQTHVSAYISRSGDTGITAGTAALAQDGLLRLNNIDRDAGILKGDIVATYGGSSQYPAQLKIGKVTSIEPDSDGLSMYAVVEPFVSIHDVSQVLVITDFGTKTADSE
ncbi:MAG: rod shape-determining protein MreC [Ruminococcaceae bacterium]|nr:rod shape-determining protein MreC [Oscillospiraceae bacterium]MBQ2781401.1 rod shape-determining protein MreC [Clostridia bacterium]MBQ7302031.1 rod shape-determining protein MreC [Clostridia bacterium]